ncbi:MAG TPA: hypothetical protein VF555_16500 [Variovorax sp.]
MSQATALEVAGRHLDHETLTLWLALLEAGGYMNLREIRRTWCAATDPDAVREMVLRLRDNNMVREKRLGGKHSTFGVTTLCSAPPGYEHLMEAAS